MYDIMELQATLEYIMTYGWAVLIIAIVLGALYGLGVFGSNVFPYNVCVAQPGYLCTNLVLNSTGYLGLNFAPEASPITITGLGCSTTSAAPTNVIVASVPLRADQNTTLVFKCPVAYSSIGTPLAATLWIVYSQAGSPVLEASFATVATRVSTFASFLGTTYPVGNCVQLLSLPFSGTTQTELLELNITPYSQPSFSVSASNNRACNKLSNSTTTVSVSGSNNIVGLLAQPETPNCQVGRCRLGDLKKAAPVRTVDWQVARLAACRQQWLAILCWDRREGRQKT